MSIDASVSWLIRCLLLAALPWSVSPAALAQTPTGKSTTAPLPAKVDASGPAWSKLTPQQRQALAPLERDWPSIDSPRKSKWLEVATRFPALPPEEQQRVQTRMAEWARLTPAERGQARLSFQESKQLSREEKQQRWEAYQALPADERRALAERARPADERTRQASSVAAPLSAAPAKGTSPPAAAASGPSGKPVAPTIVQAKPGATTTLMTKSAVPPAHQHPGQPKIAAQPGQVDRTTLLPQSGPQAAVSAPRLP